MTERELFDFLPLGWIGLAAVVFVALQVIDAPYGRHHRRGWGPEISDKLGWIIMELPAVVVMPVCFALGTKTMVTAAFLFLWELHYVNRTFVYPLRTRTTGKRMPLMIAATGAVTNTFGGYVIGRWLFTFAEYPGAWLVDPRFIVGCLIFAGGFILNNHSDTILLGLRRPEETGYRVPHGGAFRWVSCPNYLGELVEWAGFALVTWSLPAAAFFAWTAANLIPRARANHRWYRDRFDDYPKQRRAVIPFLL